MNAYWYLVHARVVSEVLQRHIIVVDCGFALQSHHVEMLATFEGCAYPWFGLRGGVEIVAEKLVSIRAGP